MSGFKEQRVGALCAFDSVYLVSSKDDLTKE
jgi:hypothetical protein